MKPLRMLFGTALQLPPEMIEQYPELSHASWRQGGLFLRIGGLLLGRSTVSGITLWHTIWLASDEVMQAELLLHELRHVHQFQDDSLFALRYLWSSLRHGYTNNPYEADARAFAARRIAESHLPA
ncbi:MAG: hypothetical protein M3Z05_08100 [Gemmatimonadota bacterium]|nr:hypothetical protein [Gemmatimonadota bacterium]